jgi:GNAT superfamily N-acetyltransferase
MQNIASEIFAMNSKATAGWNFIKNKNESYVSNMRNDGRIPEGINTLDDLQDYMDQRIVAEANEHKEVYTQFIHAMYNSTQDALKEAGIDGMILYRGTEGAEMKDNDKLPLIFSLFGLGFQDLTKPEFKDFINKPQEGYVKQRPMSSWSTKFEIANTFSTRYGSDVPLIAGVKIPAERIFAFPGSGFGCYNEAEVVVLGGELTPATYVVPKSFTLDQKSEFLETVKSKVGPKTILTMERENGDFVEFLDNGPSPKEERPIFNIDNSNENADWMKQVSWDLPTDMTEFLNMFSTRDQLSYFMTQPVAVGMPEEMSRSLWPAADEHFKKIDELPKPEEPKYLTEPFDPQDPNLDLEAFYNFDYSKNPDGSPLTRSQAGEMGYAELAVLREIQNGTEEDIKNAKRHRLDTYLKITAKPNPKSTTTVESVDDQIEGDFDLDSPVEEYRSPYNPAISLKRYVNYFTDKYGRRYVLLTDTSQNNTGNLYVTAYDTTGKTPEQVQEDFIDSKNYSTPDLHIAFLGAANAAPDYSDKNYESKRYVDLVTTSLEYRRRGLAAALLNVARKYSTEPILHSDTLSNAGFVFSNSVDRDPRDHINEKSIAWQEENSTSGPSPKEESPVGNFPPEPFDPRDRKIDLDTIYNYDYTQMPDGTPFNTGDQEQMDAISRRLEQVIKNNNGDTTAFAVQNLKNFRRTKYQQIIAKPTEGSSTTRDSILKQVEFSDKPAIKYFDEARGLTYTRYVDKFTDKYGRKYYIVTNIDESSGRQTVIAYDEKNFEGMPLPEDYVRNDQPVAGISDVGGLDSYIFRDPSVSEIQSVMVTDRYQRRGIATALVAVLEKRLGLPVVHSDNLSSMGFAFSNSMDPGKPELHTNEESIQMQSGTGPSPKEEKPSKKLRKEPFDPTDPTIDLEKFYNYDYTRMPDGRPFDVYRQQQMDILQDAIDNAPDSIERNLRINERRRIYQGYTAKPNLKSSTNLETIKNQVRLLDDNTSRMNYSGAGKPYADLSPEYKQSTQYIDEFTDKYGRQYWVVTKVVNGLGMSNVKLYDKSKNSLQDLQDNSEDILPVSMLDVFNNKISMVYTSDRYVRRGLATAALHLARERSGKEVQHSEMLTVFGRAFSISVDPNPVLHRNDESKALLLGNKTGPSPKEEKPVGGFPPEPFNPNDRTLDLDTIYNYDYTKLPDGTPFDAKQQKAMDHENKLLEDAIASGDDSKIRAAKIARRYTYSTFTTVANPDSKTNMETIADQITLGKSKPKKFTGFVRYTDNFIDKYGRKYVIFTDISTDDSSDNAAIVTAHDLESQFLTTLYTPEGMENVDRFGGKYLHIASLKVDDSDRKDLNGTSEIGIVGTDDAYRRRGLATALLYLARKHYKKPVNHSSTLTRFGRAFSNSVDAGKPDLHDSLESKQLQIDLLRKKGLPVEEPELDGDEIDYGPSPKEETPPGQPIILTNKYLEVVPLNNSYRDKNDPELDITDWVKTPNTIYGIGNGGNPLGYVRTEKLATMKGNLADMESSVSSISQDLEDGTGYLEPVLVWYNPLTGRSFIAEGNHRVEAARLTGREYVPVIVGVSTVDFKNPSKMEREGGVGDTVLNKDGSLENFKNVKDGSLINPYHLFNDEDLLYPRINLDPNDVPGFTDVLKIQSDLLDRRMSENQETGINDIAKWYDSNTFDVDSSIGYMGGTSEQLKEITAKNIGKNMLSSPKDILGALDHAVSISEVLRSRLSYLDSQKMALKALDTKLDDLNGNSIILFVDDSEHSPYEGLHLETLREVVDFMDPYDEELYGNPYDEKTIDYKTLFEDYYANENKKPIFFDNPDDIEAFKEKAASILVAQWAETSNGSDLVSHALQIAAAEAFNMPAGSWAPWKAQGKDAQTTKDVLENAEYYYGIHSSVLKDFLRTMYDNTQQELKNQGIKHLLVYRGTGVDQEAVKIDTGIEYNGIGDAEIIQRPMSAWAWLHGDAFNFATSRLQERAGMFMGTIVPVEQVLSIPGTGFGCFEEAEVVLLAGRNRLVRAVTSDSSDPPLNQKAFISHNSGQVISYLLDQLPKDKNAFDNLIEFNKSDFGSTGPSPKEEKPLNVDNSIENSDWVISEFAKKKEAAKSKAIVSAAKDIASSGVGFIPGSLKLKGSIATDGPDISISGSPKDRAKAPSDQATALKNEMISLGHTVLDDAIALSDEQAKAEGLIPEGYTAEEYRKKLENDVRAVEVGILRGDSKFRSMSQDLMRNAFNRLSYEDKEEIFQSLRQEALRGQGGALSGKDINVFSAEETFNMLLVEYGDDLAYKLSYDYATPYPEFLFDTGKTVLMRQRAEFTGRLTKKVKEEKTLVDVTWAHEGPDTILSMLTKWAIQTGKIDMSEFTQKAAEIKDFRDKLNSLPKAKDFTNKYHSMISKNIKSQLEKAGVEFDSVPAHSFFKQYKNYKLINTNDHFQDVRYDNNRKLIKNLEDTLSLIPKDIILAGMDYLKETGGMLGVQVSDARAHFVQHWLHGGQIVNMIRKNGQQSDGGYFRGDSADDYLHEVWHFFQMINPDISTMEHAFTYDRVKEANSPDIFPIMELYETSVEKSFSGAKVVNPYTVKQYKRMTSKMSSFSPLNHSAEVITTTMQDLFTSPGRFSTPNGVTVKTGTGKKTTIFSDAHMDIATGIWYTDATMTTKIDPALITGIEGLDVSNDTDWDLKAFGIGLLLSLLNWENK